MANYIVLGAGSKEVMMNRVFHLIDILHSHRAKPEETRIVFTGHNGEADYMYLLFKEFDLESRYNLVIEGSAHDTFSNFTESLKLIPYGNKTFVITSKNHIWRAIRLANFVNKRFFNSRHRLYVPIKLADDNVREPIRFIKNLLNHKLQILGVRKI